MKAVKANKEYRITEADKNRYINEGFDIKDNSGTVIAYGKGKTIPYEKYQEAVEKLKILESGEVPQNQEEIQDVLVILNAYAGEHGVKLGNAVTVSGIVKKIKAQTQEGAK